MKNFTTLLLFLYFSVLGFSQTYTGKIVDREKEPIAYANILAFRINDEKLISGVITNDNGDFELKITEESPFYLEISFIGFETQKIKPTKTSLGTIILKEKYENLEEIVITARKKIIEQKVDRLVFNVENSPYSIGGDLTDALKITPKVIFANDNISILGKQGVKVMVNGRVTTIPSGGLTNFLSSIQTDDVKAIEVITNPSAEFDAEGNYGLINIIYKKRENFWQTRFNSRYIQTTYPALAMGSNFSYFKNKMSLFVDINGKKGNEGVVEKSNIFYPNQLWESVLKRKDKKDFLSGRLSMQYDITDKLSFGLQYIAGLEKPDIEDENISNITKTTNNALDSVITSKGYNDIDYRNHSLNFYGILKLDSLGKRITFDIDYFNYKGNQNRNFKTQTSIPNGAIRVSNLSQNISEQNINNYSFKTDVIYPMKNFNIEYGGKLSFINNENSVTFFNNTNGVFVLDPLQSDDFDYKENTQSLYASVSHKLNNKWQFKVGIRFENTQTKGVSKTLNRVNKTSYNKLFPTTYISFTPNNNNNFSLNYGRRINRPKFWEINPFRWYVNEFTFSEGNPFLQPSFKDNLELNHTYKGNLTTILFTSLTSNGFGQIPLITSDTNTLKLTRDNFFRRYNYGLGIVYRFNKIPWLSSFIHTQAYYSETKFNSNIDKTLLNQEKNGIVYTISNYNTFIFNKKRTFLGELNFWYNSKKRIGLYETDPSYSVSLGVRTLFFNNDLQISFNIYDVFKTSSPNMNTFYNNGINRVANIYYDNRYFKVSMSYRFGNKKIKSRKRRFGNEDEKGRL